MLMGSRLCPESDAGSGRRDSTWHMWLFIRVLLKYQLQEPSLEPCGQVINYKFSAHRGHTAL